MIGLSPAASRKLCQDISIAGKGKGLIDEEGNTTRSGLWFTYAELISKLRPRFAIMENVGALTHRGLDAVLGSLSEIGYDAEWQDIRAEDMGAPHKRERIWIVAYPNRESGSVRGDDIANAKKGRGGRGKQRGCGSNDTRKFDTKQNEEMAYPSSNRRPGEGENAEVKKGLQPGSEPTGELESRPEGCGDEMADTRNNGNEQRVGELREDKQTSQRRKNYRRGEEINEIGEWWAVEPAICGMVNGLSDELEQYQGRLTNQSYKRVDRFKGLGNAIVPQIAELLFRLIKVHL